MFVEFAIIFMLGTLVGLVVRGLIKRPVGTLLIDKNNPEKDLYRFDIEHLSEIDKRKYILLKVDPNANLSQK